MIKKRVWHNKKIFHQLIPETIHCKVSYKLCYIAYLWNNCLVIFFPFKQFSLIIIYTKSPSGYQTFHEQFIIKINRTIFKLKLKHDAMSLNVQIKIYYPQIWKEFEIKNCTWWSLSVDSLCSMNMLTDLHWLFLCIEKHFFDTFQNK